MESAESVLLKHVNDYNSKVAPTFQLILSGNEEKMFVAAMKEYAKTEENKICGHTCRCTDNSECAFYDNHINPTHYMELPQKPEV